MEPTSDTGAPRHAAEGRSATEPLDEVAGGAASAPEGEVCGDAGDDGSSPAPDAEEPPGQAAPGQAAPGQAAPGQAAPGQAAPGQAAPEQAAPGQAAPGEAAPGEAAPGEAAPGEAAPGEAAPGEEAEADPARVSASTGSERGAARRLPVVPEQILVGLLTSVCMGVADVVRCALDDGGAPVSAGEFALSALHLIVFYLPLGLALGLAMAVLVTLLRRTPTVAPLRARLAEPRLLLRNDPELFAGSVGLASAVAIVVLGTRWIHELLATRVHREDLASWAMGGLAVAIALAAALGWAAAAALIRPLARRMGPVASGATLAVLASVGLSAGGYHFFAAHPQVTRVYGLAPILWGPAAFLAYVVALGVVRLVGRRRGPARGWRRRRAWAWSGAALAAVIAIVVTSALTYAKSNRVRGVVEQRSVLGQPLVRRYARLTDMDGDGHAWAFGGRDCNDLDASVHPGASDPAGDGVDADCFAGDGSPDVADLGDGAYGTPPASLPDRPNILLITIDALRPDHLGFFGYERDTSPNIDRFAGESTAFRTVVAQSSRSIRSIPAMMTGRYASQIAYGPEYLYPALLPVNTTVPELLQTRGYRTAVTMGTDYFHRVSHFFQGFDDVEEILVYKPPRDRAVDVALSQLRQLAQQDDPFFHWVHLFHVHGPWLRPPIRSRYGPEDVDKYDTEVHLADEQFQRLLNELDRLDLSRDTVVVLASDHGEAFREHGKIGHSTTLYEEELLSTLFIRIPGVEPRVIDGTVPLFDVGPTLLNLANVPVPEPIPARSLVPLITGEAEVDTERLLFSEILPDGLFAYDIKSIRRGNDKLIWWVQDGTFQLFDLETDPGEREDLSDERPEQALELLGLLQAWVAQTHLPTNRTDQFVEQHRLEAPPEEMTHPLDLRYPGLFTVLGCDLPETHLHPGDVLDLTCYYRVDSETDLDLFFRVMLEPPRGYPMPRDFHAMHYPLHSRYHTDEWRSGEIISDPMPMVVPPDLRVPVELRLTFAVHVRGRALLGFEQAGRTSHAALIDTIEITPRPDGGRREDRRGADAAEDRRGRGGS